MKKWLLFNLLDENASFPSIPQTHPWLLGESDLADTWFQRHAVTPRLWNGSFVHLYHSCGPYKGTCWRANVTQKSSNHVGRDSSLLSQYLRAVGPGPPGCSGLRSPEANSFSFGGLGHTPNGAQGFSWLCAQKWPLVMLRDRAWVSVCKTRP